MDGAGSRADVGGRALIARSKVREFWEETESARCEVGREPGGTRGKFEGWNLLQKQVGSALGSYPQTNQKTQELTDQHSRPWAHPLPRPLFLPWFHPLLCLRYSSPMP